MVATGWPAWALGPRKAFYKGRNYVFGSCVLEAAQREPHDQAYVVGGHPCLQVWERPCPQLAKRALLTLMRSQRQLFRPRPFPRTLVLPASMLSPKCPGSCW